MIPLFPISCVWRSFSTKYGAIIVLRAEKEKGVNPEKHNILLSIFFYIPLVAYEGSIGDPQGTKVNVT